MPSGFQPKFFFACCQVGAEAALKEEIARDQPELRFAYSRPGFLTFKLAEGTDPARLELRSVFARAWGFSVGKATPAEIANLANELRAEDGKSPHLHVWERDRHPPGEEPKGYVRGALEHDAVTLIRAAGAEFSKKDRPGPGETVIDVILLEPGELWLGFHRQSSGHSLYAGGIPPIEFPSDAPSRAYLKLEEALLWSQAPFAKGDVAVEIGSAPGGASFAMLKRGLKVVGIDPGEMAPIVARDPGFTWIQRPVAQVPREELPESVQWLCVDMNINPNNALFAVDRLATRMKDSLLGVMLTLKLNEWRMTAEIPLMLEHVKAMGMKRVRATQLFHNRQEIFVYGLTRKGMLR